MCLVLALDGCSRDRGEGALFKNVLGLYSDKQLVRNYHSDSPDLFCIILAQDMFSLLWSNVVAADMKLVFPHSQVFGKMQLVSVDGLKTTSQVLTQKQ